jgi:crossover junction endodeoxyribonuclease RusA
VTDEITLVVYGLPAPQGSKTKLPNGAMVDGGSKEARSRHRDWRSAVADAAHKTAQGRRPLDGPLMLEVEFRFPMPASRPKREQTAGRIPKQSAPDLDKLVRALGDGLTAGGLIRDDARIWMILASKVEVIGWTGATVRIKFQQPEGDTQWTS